MKREREKGGRFFSQEKEKASRLAAPEEEKGACHRSP